MAIKFLSAIDHGAYQLPTVDGSNGQVLTTDGNGNVTFQSVSSSSNYYLSGASFNTSDGVLTLTVTGASNQTVDLDGRYALSNHSHNYDNYGSWNLKTNGTQRTTVQSGGDLNLVAGTNVSLSYSAGGTVTITSTDTNTDTNDIDYINSASFNTGNGVLSLTGVGNAGASVDLDGRYVEIAGDTMTGDLNLGNNSLNAVENIYLDNAIYSQGDTNTYTQFHSGDQWRVVTGGGERLEVTNTHTYLQNILYLNSNLNTTSTSEVHYGNISTSANGTVVRGGFMNPASEGNMVHLPHLVNDLSGFNHWGTISVSGLYKSRSGSSGNYTYGSPVTVSDFDNGAAFDSYSSTAGSWYSDNGPDGQDEGVGVITLEWTNELTYSAWVGIVFGSGSFTAQRVKIEAYRGGAWQTLCDLTNNTSNVVLRQIGSNSGGGSATTKLRYTLGGSNVNSYFRIHTLYAANYRAGDNNISNLGTALTRGVHFFEKYKDNYGWGSYFPATNASYDLGSSSRRWKSIYADGGDSTQWNTAYGWGNHASAGYLTSFTETDPIFSASPAAGITPTNISNWNTAYGWGNHASAGYAMAGDENIIDGATSIWNPDGDGDVFHYNDSNPTHNGKYVGAVIDVYGDGNGMSALIRTGLLTSDHVSTSNGYYVGTLLSTTNSTTTQVIDGSGNWTGVNIPDGKIASAANWNAAYNWGDHSAAGYLTSYTDTNDIDYISSASFNTGNGILSLSGVGNAGASVDLDGRYQLAGTYNTIIGTDSDINTSGATVIDQLNMTDGVITSHSTRTLTAANLGITQPDPPTLNALNIVGETIEVVFDQSPTSGVDKYEIWSSVSGGSYGLISTIPREDVSPVMTAIDAAFSVSGTQAYRVYAVKNGIYSVAATGSTTFNTPSLSVVNMSVINLNPAYYIQYDLPDSRFIDHIEIYMDAETTSSSLSRTGASLIYSGSNSSYMYQIGASDLDKFHQFWVEVVAS